MYQDIVKGQWKMIRDNAKVWWDRLTDDDLDVIDGNRDQLLGKLEQRYGYSRDRATKEINRRLEELERMAESKNQV